MSVRVQALVWSRAPYSGGKLLVLLALADWSDDEGNSWPAIPTLAFKARLKERQTQYVVRELEADGMLTIAEGGGKHKSHNYQINIQKLIGMTERDVRETVQNLHPKGKGDRTVQAGAASTTSVHPRVQSGAPQPVQSGAPDPLVDPSRDTSRDPSSAKRGKQPALQTKRQFEAAIQRIWARWKDRFRDVLDVNQYKLNDERYAMLNERLRSPKCHWTERDCIMGIEGLRLSKWHMGDNPDHKKYLDIKYIFQDDTTLEKRIIDYREWETRMAERKAIEESKKVSENCQLCKGSGFSVRPAQVPVDLTPVPAQVWDTTLTVIKAKLPPESFESWFASVKCEGVNCEKVYLSTPNEAVRDWLKVNYGEVLCSAIAETFARGFEIAWVHEQKVPCNHKA